MLPHPRTPRAAAGAAVAGMVKIPAAAAFDYDVTAMVDQVTLSRSKQTRPTDSGIDRGVQCFIKLDDLAI